MKRHLWPTLLCAPLLACGSSHSASPDGKTPDGKTPDSSGNASVEVDIDQSPLLVVFRDGLDQPWQAASMVSSMRYTVGVHGPYVVAVVTDDSTDPSSHSYTTRWFAQTPDDDHTIMVVTKGTTLTGSNVTGQMVQPGRVFLGDDLNISNTPNWSITMTGAAGPHDLFAFSTDHALVRHAVDTTHDVALGTLDLDANGVAMPQLAFTATNAGANATLNARAAIETSTTLFASISHFIPANAVRVVPDSALASTDHQTVSVASIDGNHQRYLRKPFHVGDSTAYTLPNLLGGGTFTMAPDTTFSWTTIASAFTSFDVSVYPNTGLNYYDASATPSFIAATGVNHLALDVQLPGYQPAWKLDVSMGYDLDATIQNVEGDQIETDEYNDPVDASLRFAPATTSRARSSMAKARLQRAP
jgi:hypothetical protein